MSRRRVTHKFRQNIHIKQKAMNDGTAEGHELAKLFASMSILDDIRGQDKLPMPDVALAFEFEKLTLLMLGRTYGGSAKIRMRRICETFGVPPIVMAKLWELLIEHQDEWPIGLAKHHLLWSLHKLKDYGCESTMVKTVSMNAYPVDEKTFRKWTKEVIMALQELKYTVVSSSS
jgi:hypothetical protein